MSDDLRFFAVTHAGARPLPIPSEAHSFTDLLVGLPLGVYSALRTYSHNHFLYLQQHFDRTDQSMALLGWADRLDRPMLCGALDAVVTAVPWQDSRVRFDVLARSAPDKLGTDGRLLLAVQRLEPIPPAFYANGVAVGIAAGLSRANPLVKTAAYTRRRAAFLAQHHEDMYEYLLLDEAGRILEGTGTNFWGVRQGVLYTAGEGVLEGITRKIILQLAPQLGIPVRLEAVPLAEVGGLDEAALSGSSRAFLPVVQVAGQVVGNGRPGPVSKRILQAYNNFLAANTKRATQY